MRSTQSEFSPELIRLVREDRTALQRLSLLIASFEARAYADDVGHVLRTWPQAWGEDHRAIPPQREPTSFVRTVSRETAVGA